MYGRQSDGRLDAGASRRRVAGPISSAAARLSWQRGGDSVGWGSEQPGDGEWHRGEKFSFCFDLRAENRGEENRGAECWHRRNRWKQSGGWSGGRRGYAVAGGAGRHGSYGIFAAERRLQ